MADSRQNFFSVLQSDLKIFDKIFLVIDSPKDSLTIKFCKSKAVKNSKYKILVLSVVENIQECGVTYRQITEEDCNMLCRLYNMYEFSDKFQILSKKRDYGSSFNFVETGIFNMEDLFEVLMY